MDAAARHAELTRLFGELIERDEAARAADLARIRMDRPDLATELAALLRFHERSARTLDGILPLPAAEHLAPREWLGRRLGSWQLEQLLGEGGMGQVYLANRVDGGFEQQAALKLLRASRPGPAELSRFRRERDVLARLDHPGIARLIDGGESPDGVLYLVMEFIEGEPIDRYCRRRNLDYPARAALVDEACAAIEWAHQRLVIHRDIKPDNLMVDAGGRVRVLDFGIADLIEPDARARPQDPGTRALTPGFAAPELHGDGAVTTASDVYALGLLAYLLFSDISRDQLLGLVEPTGRRDWPALAPSARAQGRETLARQLPPDLDLVLARALAPEPEERYGSVEALREDLRRARDRMPVRAHRGGAAYRMRRFVGRHRLAVAASGVAIGALLLSTGWSIHEAQRANREAGRADLALARSERINQFLWSVLTAPDPSMRALGWTAGRELTVAELLEGLAGRVDTALAGDPVAAINVRLALGQSELATGRGDQGLSLFETAREAADTLDPVLHPEALELRAVARHMLGRRAQLRQDGDAEAWLETAVAAYASAPQLTPLRRMSAVAALHDLGLARMGRDRAAGETLIRQAIARGRQELPAGNPVLPISLRVLAEARLTDGAADEASQLAAEALQALGPTSDLSARIAATVLLADAEARSGQREAALRTIERARELFNEWDLADPGRAEQVQRLAEIEGRIGR